MLIEHYQWKTINQYEMKTIEITKLDFTRLTDVIYNFQQFNEKGLNEIVYLKREIKRAHKRESCEIGSDYVTMNSIVEITYTDLDQKMQIELVYPKDANFKLKKVSVVSFLGSALIGQKVGNTITYNTPKGKRDIRINQIIYQPEANGVYYL